MMSLQIGRRVVRCVMESAPKYFESGGSNTTLVSVSSIVPRLYIGTSPFGLDPIMEANIQSTVLVWILGG